MITSNGTYGPTTFTTLNGNLHVNSDATLRNLTVNGTIYVNPGQNGNVTLDNVVATNIVILSGGTNSIILNNVKVTNQLTVKDDDSVRVEARGTTNVAKTLVQSGAILQVATGTSGKFGAINLAPTSAAPVTLKGNFGASAIQVTAPNTVLNVDSSSQVGTLTVNAAGSTVNNAGTIAKVEANEDIEITGAQPETVVPGTDVTLNAKVQSETEFYAALEKGYHVITLAHGFEVTKPLQVSKKITLEGNNKTITRASGFTKDNNVNSVVVVSQEGTTVNNLTVNANRSGDAKWQGLYAFQVYNTSDVNLNKVTFKNADAGLIVNGATATVTDITTSNNKFGGIEVSKGAAPSISNSKLTINGTSQHDEQVAVWAYPLQTLNAVKYSVTAKNVGSAHQTYYHLTDTVSSATAAFEQEFGIASNTLLVKLPLDGISNNSTLDTISGTGLLAGLLPSTSGTTAKIVGIDGKTVSPENFVAIKAAILSKMKSTGEKGDSTIVSDLIGKSIKLDLTILSKGILYTKEYTFSFTEAAN